MEEEWKEIEGYEGLYRISSHGRVFNIKRNVFVFGGYNWQGYQQIGLLKDGYYHNNSIHRLVAKAFIPNPENKPTVDHIKSKEIKNNRVDNLRWATCHEQAWNKVYKGGASGEHNIKQCGEFKYRVTIMRNGAYILKQNYETLEEAIYYRDNAIKQWNDSHK